MILVTGGQGKLGQVLVPQLQAAGNVVRITSRHATGANAVQSDLSTGEGLHQAVEGVEVVIHAASHPVKSKAVDIAGTQRLLEAAPHVRHFIYVSIVGVDKHPLPYFKIKYQTEQLIQQSGVPYTIVRATQFHYFIEMLLNMMMKLPVGVLPAHWQFQPIDLQDVSTFITHVASQKPTNGILNIGGPQVHRLEDLAQTWLAAQGRKKSYVQLPVPGGISAAYRAGLHTIPQEKYGKIGWMEWLAGRYGV